MALKRDSKGRFLKRNGSKKKRRASKSAAPRKRKAGLKGHKPGCKCVIHARRRRANPKRRRVATKRVQIRTRPRRASPKRRRTAVRSKGPVAIQLSKAEATSFRRGAPKIRRKVQLRAAGLLRSHSSVQVVGPSGAKLAAIHR